jgi:hypothetical protein
MTADLARENGLVPGIVRSKYYRLSAWGGTFRVRSWSEAGDTACLRRGRWSLASSAPVLLRPGLSGALNE